MHSINVNVIIISASIYRMEVVFFFLIVLYLVVAGSEFRSGRKDQPRPCKADKNVAIFDGGTYMLGHFFWRMMGHLG